MLCFVIRTSVLSNVVCVRFSSLSFHFVASRSPDLGSREGVGGGGGGGGEEGGRQERSGEA